jgi:hypothetical protein
MRADAGDASTPLPGPDGPVVLIGTVDGAGDRLTELLGGHPRLCRIPRSRLLVDLAIAIARNQPALAVYGRSGEYWLKAAGVFFDGLQRDHVARTHTARWVTFASSSSLTLDQLSHLFPTAQFVHVVTPPRGGAGRIVAANRRTGAALPAGTYLEVAEGEMLTNAEACVGRVLRFLGEDDVILRDPETLIDLADHLVRRSLG